VPQPVRLATEIGSGISLNGVVESLALSPDGERLAFVGEGGDQKTRIYLRALDQLQALPLPATENGRDPFFPPDGRWIGFFSDGKLKNRRSDGVATTAQEIPLRGYVSWVTYVINTITGPANVRSTLAMV
jgi:hypothetical protein